MSSPLHISIGPQCLPKVFSKIIYHPPYLDTKSMALGFSPPSMPLMNCAQEDASRTQQKYEIESLNLLA